LIFITKSFRILGGAVKIFFILFFFLYLAAPVKLKALDPDKPVTGYKVRIWNIESGLPANSVYAVRQTQEDYLWIGTQKGLVRFDGVRFQLYNQALNPRLKSDIIRALFQDQNGTLWIGTQSGGLTSFKEGEFFTYPVTGYPALNRIRALNRDRWGNLWIGSSTEGLTCFSHHRFVTYTTKEVLPHNQVNSMYRDDNDDLWVVTETGIIRVIKPGEFKIYAPQTVLPYSMNTCLYDNETGELWIGTIGKGLIRWKNGSITVYGRKAGLPGLTINTLYKDRGKNLWIGTDGGGLTRMRIGDGQMSTISRGNGLADGFVYPICEDNEGSLWVGTLDGGLHQLSDNKFTTYTTKQGLVDDYVGCITRDRDGGTWIGTKGGLSRMSSGVFTTRLTTKEGLLDNAVSSLFEDSSGSLWIGTRAGLHKYRLGKLTTLTQKNGLSDNRITCILGDQQGNTWVGTVNGLNRLDSSGMTITHFTAKEGLSGSSIELLYEDSKGSLWIGTDAGLNYLEDGSISVYPIPGGMEISHFHCAYEDNDGVTWFGTDSGLLRLKAGETTLYTLQNGLIENQVYSVLEDNNGFLWLAGSSGISRVRKQELEDAAGGKPGQVHPDWYNETDGMKSRWCTGAGDKTRDGRFWFPTAVGVTMIDPNDIKKNEITPLPIIEKLVVDGETVNKSFCGGSRGAVFSKRGSATPTHSRSDRCRSFGASSQKFAEKTRFQKVLVKSTPLELAPGKKRFEFYYTAVSFTSPQKIRFKVKLEGYDSDWVDMKTLRTTTYTGLQPGKYTFRVTAGKTAGAGETNEVSFSFYLQPYFYQTTWFYVFMVLFVLLMAFSLHRYRLRQLRARKEELKRLVELRTRELEKQSTQLGNAYQQLQQSKELIEAKNQQLQEQSEKLKELDKAKSHFFANISHEFRNPLTLIMWPAEQILDEYPDKDLETMANMILGNSRRLLNLVDQLLELAKLDSGKMELQAELQNIVPYVKSLVMCFKSPAWQNKIELNFQAESQEIFIYFDPEKIERIITNLLSNAFNYTPKGGKISVSIRSAGRNAAPGACVEIAVCDTGIGIPVDQLPHIFDRFYQGDTTHKYMRKGTGIGLALVKELMELHRGEIEVRSSCQPDHTRGTEFILRLPRGKTHLQPGEIVNEAKDIKTVPHISRAYYPPLAKAFDDLENNARSTKDNEPGPGTAGAAKKEIILVADDDEDMRYYIRIALEPYFNVVEVENGKEGMDKAVEIIPDLVVSDVMMPELDGFELCARLKKDIKTCHIPVILLTAKASEKSMAGELETGADDYITKPFNIDLLVIRVKNLLRLHRQLQQKIHQDIMLQSGEAVVSSIDTEFIKEIKTIIEKNLSDPEFNLEQMAKELFMSPKTLGRKVEALTGESPNRLIRSYRLARAVQLLKANFGSVTEVAFAVGFSSTAYFTKCFKEKFHRLPYTFQESGSGKG